MMIGLLTGQLFLQNRRDIDFFFPLLFLETTGTMEALKTSPNFSYSVPHFWAGALIEPYWDGPSLKKKYILGYKKYCWKKNFASFFRPNQDEFLTADCDTHCAQV